MSKNQIVFWKAVILLSLILGVALSSLWLLNGNVISLPIGIIFLVFGAGLAVILHRATKTTED